MLKNVNPASIPEGCTLTQDGLICPLDLIEHSPELLRPVDQSAEKFTSLVASIRKNGVMAAIQVQPMPRVEGQPQKYWACNGNQRLAASKALGLTTIPVQVKDWDVNQSRINAITLNAQFIPTRRASYAAALSRHFANNPSLTMKEVAEQIGFSEVWVKEQLSLLNLAEPIQTLVDQEAMPVNNAVMLAKLSPENQEAFLSQAQQLSVADFTVVVDEQLAAERKARKEGKSAGDPVYTPRPYARKTEEFEAILGDPNGLYNQIVANGAKGAKDVLVAAMNWAIHMDPVSIKEGEQDFYKKLQDRKDAKLKHQKDRLDEKEKEIATQKEELAAQLKARGLTTSAV